MIMLLQISLQEQTIKKKSIIGKEKYCGCYCLIFAEYFLDDHGITKVTWAENKKDMLCERKNVVMF